MTLQELFDSVDKNPKGIRLSSGDSSRAFLKHMDLDVEVSYITELGGIFGYINKRGGLRVYSIVPDRPFQANSQLLLAQIPPKEGLAILSRLNGKEYPELEAKLLDESGYNTGVAIRKVIQCPKKR